jgi:hypothetical protein
MADPVQSSGPAPTANAGQSTDAGQQQPVGEVLGGESSLSNWAGADITDMLARARALTDQGYQAYTGQLTADESALQQQAFQGLAGLSLPTAEQGQYNPGTFDAAAQQQYMNPYLQGSLNPQLEEARRQAEISNLQNRTAATRAGAFGGGRQAIMESESQRNMLRNLADITGEGYNTAFQQGRQQFNTEQDRLQNNAMQMRDYGLRGLDAQSRAGEVQRSIEQEGIQADIDQYSMEQLYPYKQLQFQQSMYQNMPLQAQSYNYSQPSEMDNFISTYESLGGDVSGGLGGIIGNIGGTLAGAAGTALGGIIGGGDSSGVEVVESAPTSQLI